MDHITCVNGSVLKWARLSSGKLDQKFYIENIDRIRKWEDGNEYPTYSQLEKLAEIYKKPVAIFFFPNPPVVDNYQTNFRTMSEVEISDIPYKVVRLINEALVMKLNLYELNDGQNPAGYLIHKRYSWYKGRNLNKELREILNVPIERQIKINSSKEMFEIWRDAFYSIGINVFKEAFYDINTSGFCIFDDEFPIIYINNSMSYTRQIFTLFHEFYHLINKTGGIDKIKDTFNYPLSEDQLSIEKNCNSFAAEFLIPSDHLLSDIANTNITLDFVKNLAIRYCVSRESLILKLISLDKLSWDFYNQYIDDINDDFYRNKPKTNGGNYYNTLVSYLGNNYLKLAFSAYKANKIDEYQLSQYTKVKINYLSALENAWGWK